MKVTGNSFVCCLVDDVKRHENDVELHQARWVYQFRVPIKLAVLGEMLAFSAFAGYLWLFVEIDELTASRCRGQLDAQLSSTFRPLAIVHRTVHTAQPFGLGQ